MNHPPRTFAYGPDPAQVGDLHLPAAAGPAVVCLLHGGFWRMPHGRDGIAAVARDLADRGFAAWNLEYRRLGAGGGWPETFRDVAAGIDHLAALVDGGIDLDLHRVVVVGHSAGGQLALWSVARGHRHDVLPGPARVSPRAVAGLAAVVDLDAAHALDAGGGAVAALMDGAPPQQPARYAAASPRARLPLGVPQLILQGRLDTALPVALARDYVQAAIAAGDVVDYDEQEHGGHMDFLDINSAAHAALCRWLQRFQRRGA